MRGFLLLVEEKTDGRPGSNLYEITKMPFTLHLLSHLSFSGT